MSKSATPRMKTQPQDSMAQPGITLGLSNSAQEPQDGMPEGVIKVHESVIASIVRKASCSVEGVVRLAGSTLVDNIAEIVGSKRIFDRSITVEMGESSVQIEVKVILAYGIEIPAVAQAIQSVVIDQITKITGMSVSKVNVMVMDLEDLPDEGIE
jgi:uncharacterized alkaline shock family protein YloU